MLRDIIKLFIACCTVIIGIAALLCGISMCSKQNTFDKNLLYGLLSFCGVITTAFGIWLTSTIEEGGLLDERSF